MKVSNFIVKMILFVKHRIRIKSDQLMACCIGLLCLSGCEREYSLHWAEQVELHDGRTIRVDRTAYHHWSSGTDAGSVTLKREFTVEFPGAKAWSGSGDPLMLDYEINALNEINWVVISTLTKEGCLNQKSPRGIASINKYIYSDGGWTKAELDERTYSRVFNILRVNFSMFHASKEKKKFYNKDRVYELGYIDISSKGSRELNKMGIDAYTDHVSENVTYCAYF